MDSIAQHKDLYNDWKDRSVAYQMGNIGSEVSRAIRNREKPSRFRGAYERALELFDLTIKCLAENDEKQGSLREVCRAREEFCDFFEENAFGTEAERMLRYYDQFAMIARKA